MDKGGGATPPREKQVDVPTAEDPSVQRKKAARATAARYAQGYRASIASGKADQSLGGEAAGGAAAAPGTVGTLTKLG